MAQPFQEAFKLAVQNPKVKIQEDLQTTGRAVGLGTLMASLQSPSAFALPNNAFPDALIQQEMTAITQREGLELSAPLLRARAEVNLSEQMNHHVDYTPLLPYFSPGIQQLTLQEIQKNFDKLYQQLPVGVSTDPLENPDLETFKFGQKPILEEFFRLHRLSQPIQPADPSTRAAVALELWPFYRRPEIIDALVTGTPSCALKISFKTACLQRPTFSTVRPSVVFSTNTPVNSTLPYTGQAYDKKFVQLDADTAWVQGIEQHGQEFTGYRPILHELIHVICNSQYLI